jgi:hypothetical protein
VLEFGNLCKEEFDDLESNVRFCLEDLVSDVDEASNWEDLDTVSSYDWWVCRHRRFVLDVFLLPDTPKLDFFPLENLAKSWNCSKGLEVGMNLVGLVVLEKDFHTCNVRERHQIPPSRHAV